MENNLKKEKNWILLCIIAILFVSSIPYIWGVLICPPKTQFIGFTQNIEDGAVYLSWMKQISSGSFFIRNLFTSDAQTGNQINLLFLVMGDFARVTHLNASLVFHLFRLFFSGLLIYLLWQLSKLFINKLSARVFFVFFCVFSSGVGWLIPNVQMPTGSVDIWQPEAITFLSIYLNPMFTAALCLIVGSYLLLLKFEKEEKWSLVIWAGILQFILANIHTYDVVSFWIVWAVYVIARWIIARKIPLSLIKASITAGFMMLPAALYQFWVYKTDPVYNARANTIIPSAPILSIIEGFGIAFLGALIIIILYILIKKKKELSDILLPICWAAVGILVPYLPFAQQRKLIMSAHIPYCLLTAILVLYLTLNLKPNIQKAVFAVVLLASIPSNIWFMNLDMKLLAENKTVTRFAPFLSDEEADIISYLEKEAKYNDVILAPPNLALLIPALAGKQVYYGHWSETPNYNKKLSDYFHVQNYEDNKTGEIIKNVTIFIRPSQNDYFNRLPDHKTKNYSVYRFRK